VPTPRRTFKREMQWVSGCLQSGLVSGSDPRFQLWRRLALGGVQLAPAGPVFAHRFGTTILQQTIWTGCGAWSETNAVGEPAFTGGWDTPSAGL
jgi:hypothetical protein